MPFRLGRPNQRPGQTALLWSSDDEVPREAWVPVGTLNSEWADQILEVLNRQSLTEMGQDER